MRPSPLTSIDDSLSLSANLLHRESPFPIGLLHGLVQRGGELLALLLLILKQPERGSDDFAHVVKSTCGDAFAGKALQLGRQVHIGAHRVSNYVKG